MCDWRTRRRRGWWRMCWSVTRGTSRLRGIRGFGIWWYTRLRICKRRGSRKAAVEKGIGRSRQATIANRRNVERRSSFPPGFLYAALLLNLLNRHDVADLVVIGDGHFVCVKRPFLDVTIGLKIVGFSDVEFLVCGRGDHLVSLLSEVFGVAVGYQGIAYIDTDRFKVPVGIE